MNRRSLLASLALLISTQGCGAQLFSNKGSVTVSAQGDRRVVAAGAALGAVALAAAQTSNAVGASGGVAATTGASGGATLSAGASQGTSQIVVAQITGLRVHAAGQRAVQTISGGAVAIERQGGIAVSNIVSGDLEISASAVEGEPCAVSGGSVTFASGATYRIGGGRVTLARSGSSWIIASGRITTADGASAAGATYAGAATGDGTANSSASSATTAAVVASRPAAGAVAIGRATGVAVDRVTVDGGSQVVAGGAITLTGAPQLEGLAVVDGAIEFEDADLHASGESTTAAPAAATGTAATTGARVAGAATAPMRSVSVRATARRTLRVRAGGVLVVSDRHGRRWRARVEGGQLVARTDGSNPSGRVVWEPTGGELRVTVVASGGDALTLQSAGLPEATVEFTPRVRSALTSLVAAVPADSREAARLSAAVEVVVRNAESAEPSFYAIPIRGRSLVIMVDVSYSMSDPDPQGSWFAANPSKLDVARAELVKVLASVPPGVRVNVVAFSSHVATLWPASRTMDDAGLAEAVRWVAALRPADETHPLEALEAAAALNPDQIVLLSDGRPSDSEAVLRSVVQRVDVIAARARVDVVGFGADQDREFLATLAGHGRGTLRLR